jgi:hypothetical protein
LAGNKTENIEKTCPSTNIEGRDDDKCMLSEVVGGKA